MKSIFILLFLAFQSFLMASSLKVLEGINANNDHGLWVEQNIRKNFKSNWTLKLRFEQGWASDYRQIYYQEYEAYLQYDVTKFLSKKLRSIFTSVIIGPADNFTRALQKNTKEEFHWVWFQKPMLEIHLVSSLYKWTFKQRLRGEYIAYTSKHYKNHGVGRYRLEIDSPWKWTRWKINPYLSNEWFYRQDTYSQDHPTGLVGGWYENRFRVGMMFDLFKHLSSVLYWQWMARKQKPDTHPRWFNTYQIGFVLDLSF